MGKNILNKQQRKEGHKNNFRDENGDLINMQVPGLIICTSGPCLVPLISFHDPGNRGPCATKV